MINMPVGYFSAYEISSMALLVSILAGDNGEFKLGGHAVRQAFRGIEDVIDKDALTIFQSLFLEIPLRLLEAGNIRLTQMYTEYLWQMLYTKKREEPITQMAGMLHAICASTPEALLYYLQQMHLILADILTQIRGDTDYNTINARMRTLHLQQNHGCDVSQSYLECLDSFGVLARNSTTKFSELAYEMSLMEVHRTKANIVMAHAPIALKELSDRSLAELMAGNDHSAFLQTSQSISELAQYAVATFFIHECLIQYGDLNGGSLCLMRIIEALERAQEVSSDSVIKLYLAGQLLRVRLKLSDILIAAGSPEMAETVMKDAHIMKYLGSSYKFRDVWNHCGFDLGVSYGR
ncbi:N1-acetylpolyamine oxidase [Colletotrichum kahawae]|uniref:N1-acetylpolyamine oxidase n=1 Tax=Colletotrichum kahawae TaxID=34407 RepID=A0AAD9YAG0_COLKA|nr:N1-acetylpolyamine oxidase [Colletotrichum kahawae]